MAVESFIHWHLVSFITFSNTSTSSFQNPTPDDITNFSLKDGCKGWLVN
jgi:hypothetical protein